MPRPRYTKADMRPTWTSLTVDALKRADDFMTLQQLLGATGATSNQMTAALHHLKKFRVVDAMENDGVLWFYLTGEDTRARVTEERTPEPKGNRSRAVGKYTRKPKPPAG
jgi:hypothetical protein